MHSVVIKTVSGPMAKLYAANVTTAGTSFTDPADSLTNPAANATNPGGNPGVINLGAGGAAVNNSLKLIPFGTDTAAETLLMGVYAIERIIGAPNGKNDAWTYRILAAFTCTLCTKTGVAGSAVDNTNLYCDTIALLGTSGNSNVSCEIISPTGNQQAHVIVDLKGAELAFVDFRRNGSAVNANCLWGRV